MSQKQTLEIWNANGKQHARLVCPYGVDSDGNPACIEFYESAPTGTDSNETEQRLRGRVRQAALAHAADHARGDRPPSKRVEQTRLDLAPLVNRPKPKEN